MRIAGAELGVAALAVVGPAERVLDSSGRPLRRVLEQTTEAAAAIIAGLEETH